jgi:flagellar hook-associated protein 2
MALINFSGLASGIDSEALIKATSDATRAQRVNPNQRKIQDLTDTNSALGDVKTKLSTIQTKARAFTTLSGGPLAKAATSSDETILTASASNSASNGTYTVRVSQLAKSGTLSFDDRFSSPTDAIAPSVGAESGPNNRALGIRFGPTEADRVYIDISPTTTLNDIASAINGATTKGVATVVNTGQTPPYALVLKSNSTGATDGQIDVTLGSDLTGLTNPQATQLFGSETEDAAQDAEFSITGITGTITKSSNSIADVIPGVTFNLIAEAPTTDITINISDDKAGTASKVQDFVTAFNDLISYLAEKNTIERQESGKDIVNIFGPLASSRIDENAVTAIRGAISSSVYTSGQYVRIFADLGISTERDGTLKFDSAKFQENLAKETSSVDRVLKLFGDSVANTGGIIDQQIRFGGILDNAVNNNKSSITDLNKRIADAESSIAKNEETMRARFSRLESLTSQLQSQQAALTSALAGLG